jgi:hypothetical protein
MKQSSIRFTELQVAVYISQLSQDMTPPPLPSPSQQTSRLPPPLHTLHHFVHLIHTVETKGYPVWITPGPQIQGMILWDATPCSW